MPEIAIIVGLAGATLAALACYYVKFYRPNLDVRSVEFVMETVDAQPTISLAALLSEPPRLDADSLARACERAWGGVFNGDEHAVRFVLGEPPVLMIRDEAAYYMFNTGDEPYLDNRESSLAQVDDAALRRAAQEHRGWISMDYLEEGTSVAEARANAQANIARLFGELLADAGPLAIIVPAADRAFAWTAEVGARLRGGIVHDDSAEDV